jgi:tetratricopeptide (TPR) repeat protein
MAYQVTAGRFVGRTQELARLHQLLAHASTGQPLVAVVGGEAGVGKTRLVEQLAANAADEGVRVLRGGCVPLGEEGLPFAPVVEALRGLAGELDPAELETVAGSARQELSRLLPDLAWGGEAGATAEVAAGAGQGRLFELLLGVVGRLAASMPLLWVVEDLHWADRSTRNLVAFLATYLRSGRVMVVGTFRSDELHRLHPLRGLLSELARNRRVQRVELARFTRAELTEQLAGLLGADPPARLVDDISARSQGNPFFAEELLLAGADPGVLPPSLQEVLLARVVRLGDRTQQLLRVAAAAGPGATQPLLAAVAGLDDQQLLAGLREAVDQQLLLPDPGGGDGYVFRHALLAEAVYGELLPGERVGLHTALAGALEDGLEAGDAPASRAARLAYHWAAAGDQPRALAAGVQAAAAAERVHAFAEAQLQLERALALWDRVADPEQRAGADQVALLSRCAKAAYGAGNQAEAAELARQAIALVDPARQPQRAGLLHEQLARCLRRLSDPAALDAHQQAVRLMPPQPSAERARVLGSLAQYLLIVDRFAELMGPAEEAIATAERVGARAEEANARTALGGALIYLGEPDAGLAELETAVRLATEAGDLIVMLRAILNCSDKLLAAGRLTEAATVALDGIQQARRLGLARLYGPLLAHVATEALLALGRWGQAEQLSQEGLRPARPVLPTSPCRWPGPPLSWALATWTPPRRGCRPCGACSPDRSPRPETPVRCSVGWPSWPCGAVTWSRPGSWSTRPCPRWRPTLATPRPSTPWACGWRPTAPSWPAPATPASQPSTTTPPPRCCSGWARPPAARPAPVCRNWPPGTPPPWPSAPASRAGPTRPHGRQPSRPGSGWASPTGPPTPATARPRRC